MDRYLDTSRTLWQEACLAALSEASPKTQKLVEKFHKKFIGGNLSPYITTYNPSGNLQSDIQSGFFGSHLMLAMAQNLEEAGRPLDAAELYEELQMYDKARKLREKGKQIIVKRTVVSVNLNSLLQQIKDGGIVAVYARARI